MVRSLSMFIAILMIASSAFAAGGTDEQQRLAEDVGKEFSGEAVLGSDPGLEDYLTYAALKNPGLRAAFHGWTSRLKRVPSVSSLPEPVFPYMYYGESCRNLSIPCGIRDCYYSNRILTSS